MSRNYPEKVATQNLYSVGAIKITKLLPAIFDSPSVIFA